jgi:hypothetical protein
MARILTVSFAFLMLAFPALGAGMADTASATCKDYETGSHQDMLDIEAAVLQALKGDPNFGSLSGTALDVAIDKVCTTQPDARVIDALRLKK